MRFLFTLAKENITNDLSLCCLSAPCIQRAVENTAGTSFRENKKPENDCSAYAGNCFNENYRWHMLNPDGDPSFARTTKGYIEVYSTCETRKLL
jgi:hypothetical protein